MWITLKTDSVLFEEVISFLYGFFAGNEWHCFRECDFFEEDNLIRIVCFLCLSRTDQAAGDTSVLWTEVPSTC